MRAWKRWRRQRAGARTAEVGGSNPLSSTKKSAQIDVISYHRIARHFRSLPRQGRDEQESLLDLYLRAMESAGSSQAKAALAPSGRRTSGC
jgi:hypothetical protein